MEYLLTLSTRLSPPPSSNKHTHTPNKLLYTNTNSAFILPSGNDEMSKYAGANSASQLPSTIVTVRKYGFAVLINSLYTTHCADFTDEEGYTRALYSSTLLYTLHLIILRG